MDFLSLSNRSRMGDISRQVAEMQLALDALQLTFPPIDVAPVLLTTIPFARSQQKSLLNTALEEINRKRSMINNILSQINKAKAELDAKASAIMRALSPISALPSEVLQNLFRLVVNSVKDEKKMQCATCLSLVCTTWRDVAISDVTLWQHCCLPRVTQRPELPQYSLDRAKSLPITLHIRPIEPIPEIYRFLEAKSSALRGINIKENVLSRPIEFFLGQAMDFTFEVLESLELVASPRGWDEHPDETQSLRSEAESREDEMFPHLLHRTPNLKYLKLSWITCSDLLLPNLVTLHLQRCDIDSDAWLSLLRDCPLIEEIDIKNIHDNTGVLRAARAIPPLDNIATLPRLRSFTMDQCPSYLYTLIFKAIRAPNLKYFTMESRYGSQKYLAPLSNLLRGSIYLDSLDLNVSLPMLDKLLSNTSNYTIDSTPRSLEDLKTLTMDVPIQDEEPPLAPIHEKLCAFLNIYLFGLEQAPLIPRIRPTLVLPLKIVQVDEEWYHARFANISEPPDDGMLLLNGGTLPTD